jgi:hypothetical protein
MARTWAWVPPPSLRRFRWRWWCRHCWARWRPCHRPARWPPGAAGHQSAVRRRAGRAGAGARPGGVVCGLGAHGHGHGLGPLRGGLCHAGAALRPGRRAPSRASRWLQVSPARWAGRSPPGWRPPGIGAAPARAGPRCTCCWACSSTPGYRVPACARADRPCAPTWPRHRRPRCPMRGARRCCCPSCSRPPGSPAPPWRPTCRACCRPRACAASGRGGRRARGAGPGGGAAAGVWPAAPHAPAGIGPAGSAGPPHGCAAPGLGRWCRQCGFTLLHGAGNGILTIAKGTLPLVLFGSLGYGRARAC